MNKDNIQKKKELVKLCINCKEWPQVGAFYCPECRREMARLAVLENGYWEDEFSIIQ